MRTNIGDYFFSSQYQQEPFVESGGDFKRDYFQYYKDKPDNLRAYTFVDPAISQKQEADYTAIVTIGISPENKIYILDVIQRRMLPDEIINAVFSTAMQYQPQEVGIEIVAYQKMLALEIRKQMNLRNQFFNLHEIHPT